VEAGVPDDRSLDSPLDEEAARFNLFQLLEGEAAT